MITNALSEGGVESMLLDLCQSLVNTYHYEVAILVLNKEKVELRTCFENVGVKIWVGRYKNIYNPLNILLIKRYLQWGDIVHVHLYPCQLYVILSKLLFLLRKNIPYITTEHSTFNNRRKYFFFRRLDKFMYSQYSKIICVSQQAEINLRNWLGENIVNIETINNGINIDKFRYANNALNEHIRVLNSIQYLVMVGRLEYPKDQMTVIKAMDYLPSTIHLLLVGSGRNMQKCEILAEKCGVADRVHFLGNCKDVASILKGCKIGILSTDWDGFGLVAVEYMAAGIPVIASDVEGLKDVVGNQKLLFKSRNFKELADKILLLLTDSNIYQKAKEYCSSRALSYSMQTMIKKYVYIYQSVLK